MGRAAAANDGDPAPRQFESAEAVKLWLSERFARETDPQRILRTAAAAVGEFLNAARVGYGEFDADAAHVTIPLDWSRAGVPSLAGTHGFDPESTVGRRLRQGALVIIDDVAALGPDEPRGVLALAGERAVVIVPLVHDGRLVAVFAAADSQLRHWEQDEITLVSQTGARIWGALQHLRLTEQLRESEEQFRMMAENLPGICWVGDRDAKPLWGNSRWHAMYDDTAAAHGDARGAIHPDDLARAKAIWHDMRRDGVSGEFQLRLRGRDGIYRPFLSKASPIHDASGAVTRWVGVQVDLSGQQAQNRRQAVLRSFADRARGLAQPTAILTLIAELLHEQLGVEQFIYADAPAGDMAAVKIFRALDGRAHLEEEPTLAAAFGAFAGHDQPAATFVANSSEEVPPDSPIRIASDAMGMRSGINVPLIRDGRHVAGFSCLNRQPRRWSREDIELCEDLAELTWAMVARARAEAAIAEREQQFRTLAENIPAMCWLGDRNGDVYWMNGPAEAFFGPVGHRTELGLTVHPDDQPRAAAAWDQARLDGTPLTMTVQLRGAGDEYRPFRSSTTPILDAAGRVAGWCGTMIDLSEREAHSRRQAVLRAFHDETRDHSDRYAILGAVARILNDSLGTSHFYYYEPGRPDAERAALLRASAGERADRIDVALLDTALAGIAARPNWDRPQVTDDNRQPGQEPTATTRAAVEHLAARSGVNVPIVKDGRLVGLLCVLDSQARHWSTDEIALCEELADRLWAAMARARAETELHERQRVQAFLIEWTDRTRELRSPDAIIAVTLEMLGQLHGVARTTYSVSEDAQHRLFTVRGEWREPRVASIAHTRFSLDLAGEALEREWLSGEILRYDDVADDPRVAATMRSIYAGADIAAFVTIPLIEHGHARSALSLQHDSKRHWTDQDIQLLREVADRTWVAIERARAETELQERERNQAFLIAWTDRTRDLGSADAIIAATMEMLAAQLAVARTTYSVSDHGGRVFDVCGEWHDPRVPSIDDTSFSLDDVGATVEREWVAGEIVRYENIAADPRIEDGVRDAYLQTAIHAFVSVPLIESGRVRSALSVQHDEPRAWRAGELQLLRDVADRIWVAIERARAETELQESERNQAFLIDWTDQIRDKPSPERIVAITLEQLGRHFGVTRTTYSHGDESGELLINRGEWADGVVSVAHTVFRLDDIDPEVRRQWLAGEAVHYDDIPNDPRITPARRAFFESVAVRSLVTIPLIEAGRVRSALSLQSKVERRWSETEIQLLRDVAERTWVVLERARAETELQERERNQAFLIDWTDRIRGEAEPAAIIATTLAAIGPFLGVNRATFAELDPAEHETFEVTSEWRDGVDTLLGNRFMLPSVGAVVDRDWHAGESVCFDDVSSDPRLEPAVVERYVANGIHAFLSVPLVAGGAMQSALSVQSATPRAWTEAEGQLLRDVAERTWAALERAQAQAALAERSRHQAFLVAWNDMVRGESRARVILAHTVRMLGEHLGVTCVNYCEPDPRMTRLTVIEEYHAPDAIGVKGTSYPLTQFGDAFAVDQRRGVAVRVDDVAADARFDEPTRALFEELGVGALLTLPLKRGDTVLAILSAQHKARRNWTDAEIELVRDLADRTLAVLERAQSEARLAESEAQLSAIMENAPVAMNLRDANGRYIRLNPEFGRAVQRPVEELTGLTPREIFPPHVADQIMAMHKRAMKGEVASIELMEGEGKYESVLTIAFPIGDGQGAAKTAGFTIDLSERKKAEAALQRSRDALYQTEKLTALGSLLAGVSHELNNPLSIVVAQAVMMERQSQGTEIAERAQKIRKAADRCARIVQSFLAMARQKRPEREAADLNAIAIAAHELADYGLKNDGITTLRALAPSLPPIAADSDQLHQIVINLIVNAQQAMVEAGGERLLTLRSALGERSGTVMLEVADTGPGVPAEVQRRIFEPFYTTKPQGQGTGVGLSFSQGLAEAHGGTLELVPAKTGACFRLTLPIDAALAAAPADTPELDLVAPAAPRRALVVDDEREIAESLADFLSLEGFTCEIAAGGVAAQQRLSADDGGAFDLIVSDLRMPDLDGPRLYDWVTEHRPELSGRMAFATGDTLGQTAARFLAEFERPVLEKPFTPEAVRRFLEQMDLA